MTFTRQLLSLAGASDNILNYAEKYLRIVFAGSLFVNFFQSANMVIRGEGQLKKAMTIIASGAILNIILDPIFITILNPYGMGIEAAAYATVLSQFIQAAVTLWYFKKKSPNVKIGRIRIDGTLAPASSFGRRICSVDADPDAGTADCNLSCGIQLWRRKPPSFFWEQHSGSGTSLLFLFGVSARASSLPPVRTTAQRIMTV